MSEEFDFSPIDEILAGHEPKASSAIAILQAIQERYNYLPREIFPYVSRAIGVGEAHLYGVATFYQNFSLEPKGKCIIRCCDGTACHVRKSQPIIDRIRKELSLAPGKKTTEDMLFTVETVACLGACGLAPVLTVNGEVHASMTPDKASELIAQLKEEVTE